jgi:hypothetical protein
MIDREEEKELRPCLCEHGNKVLSPTKGDTRTTSGISSWFLLRNESVIIQTDTENVNKLYIVTRK